MVLNVLDNPATTVRPGTNPPSSDPLNATFRIGKSVGMNSLLPKNVDEESAIIIGADNCYRAQP